MHKCKKCGEEKPKGEMAMYAGEVTDTCQACRWPNRKPKAPEAPPPVRPPPTRSVAVSSDGIEFCVEPSFGFTAKVEGENLVITQANHEEGREQSPDNVTLSRTEAKQLFDLFGNWIVGKAA